MEIRREWSGSEDSHPLAQYVWHPYYVDALIVRDYDSDTNGSAVRYYYTQDVNFRAQCSLAERNKVLLGRENLLLLGGGVVAWLLSCFQSLASEPPLTEAKSLNVSLFESRIRPLLLKYCCDCHSQDHAEGKLMLDSRSGWQRGGERGPAIVPGDPSASLLMRAVIYGDDKLRMPPEDAGGKLPAEDIQALSDWIRHGAVDPREGQVVVTDIDRAAAKHWAFQPVTPPAIPAAVHPIDYLIDQKLAEQGFVPAPLADMRTLVRRVCYDLTGLPPTAEQLETGRNGYTVLIDQLLASPHYGERWGRHWLDVARYSDAKDGVLMYGDARVRPFAYTYRDYVIRAFNQDMPLDQFIRQQLAADQMNLPNDSPDLAALGFLTLGRMFDGNKHDLIDDQIDVVGRGMLGLSISCARCHDHKHDPIPTSDYYSLYGVFASCVEPYNRPRIGPVAEAGQPYEQEFAAKLNEILDQQKQHYDQTLKIACQRTEDYLVQVATTEPDLAETTIFFLSLTPEQLRPQITKRWRQLVARRAFPEDTVFGPWHDLMRDAKLTPQQWKARGVDQRIIDGLLQAKPTTKEQVAQAYGAIIRNAWESGAGPEDPLARLLLSPDGPVWFPEREVANYLSRQPGDAFRGLLAELDAISVKHPQAAPRAMVIQDAELLCDPVIFMRGDPSARGLPVPRQFLSILSDGDRQPFQHGAGRLELADAIASPQNPLTARVWVNRLWFHHFGEPLVANPSDFGLQADRPVHWELLDFLAHYFIRNGWRTKPIHQLILSSAAYQRSTTIRDSQIAQRQHRDDPNNGLHWRANRRRLDLEQLRDTWLFISGELDLSLYGRPEDITDDNNFRRTIYSFVERQNIPNMFQTFDFTNADTSTARRSMTTVPQQALFALNSSFVFAQSAALGKQFSQQPAERSIAWLYQTILGRQPTVQERLQCQQFLMEQSPDQLAQVLLMTNELMFID